MTVMANLPTEIIHKLTEYLNFKEICSLAVTCKHISLVLAEYLKIHQGMQTLNIYNDADLLERVYSCSKFQNLIYSLDIEPEWAIANAPNVLRVLQYKIVRISSYKDFFCVGLVSKPLQLKMEKAAIAFLKINRNYDHQFLSAGCEFGFQELVEFLINNDRLGFVDNCDLPLLMAASHGHVNIVQILLGYKKCKYSKKSLEAAVFGSAKEGFDGTLRVLLEKTDLDPSFGNNRSLEVAVSGGHAKAASILLKNSKVIFTANLDWLLRSACIKGHLDVVKILLKIPYFYPSLVDFKCIEMALKKKHLKIVKYLLKDGRAPVPPRRLFTTSYVIARFMQLVH